MRNIKELLTLLLILLNEEIDDVDEKGMPNTIAGYWVVSMQFHGMCNSIYRLSRLDRININEENLLNRYLKEHGLPTTPNSEYWFLPVIRQPRIDWVTKELSKLESNETV